MSNTNNYFLMFSMHFDRDKGLDWGRLSLNNLNRGTIDIWVTTSSVASKQYVEGFHHKGGMIPPQYRVPNLKNYLVQTNPIPLPHVKGVDGNFYKINPHEIVTDRGGKRGDFGIHVDGNVPGSMGCPVMSEERFKSFEKRMKQLRNEGVKSVPLFVQYS